MNLNDDPWVMNGLERLREEAFGPNGFAIGASELVDVVVHRTSSSFRRGRMYKDGVRVHRGSDFQYSTESIDNWLTEFRSRAFRPGLGTWTTAEVHVYPDRIGRVELFDEEHLDRMTNGNWFPGGYPSSAAAWARQLLYYPRTVDNIPVWMWDIFRAEGVTPPVYNPEFKSVDWKNRRRPVTDRGTDFSVEPTIIDPSKEPGRFAKLTKRLFGG